MKELNEAAKSHLHITHQMDIIKVLEQMKIVSESSEDCKELSGLNKQEYTTMISLVEKYKMMLNNIKV